MAAKDVVVRAKSIDLALPGRVTQTGLELPQNLEYRDWLQLGEKLRTIEGAVLWWVGDWVNYGEREYGDKYSHAIDGTGYNYDTISNAAAVAAKIEFPRRRGNLSWAHHQEVAYLEPKQQDRWLDKAERHEWTRAELRREMKSAKLIASPAPPKGLYRTLVIDPPWPVEKIEREVRPNQAKPLDYQTLDLDTIKSASWCGGKLPADQVGCHVYLWVTQKFLPAGLECFRAWDIEYQCVLTWIKNVGFTPYSWMYSTEHVLFGHIGSLPLLKQGLRLDFAAKVREHSRKPKEFYDLVCCASPEPRIDMFARETHDGFVSWGNEEGKFQ